MPRSITADPPIPSPSIREMTPSPSSESTPYSAGDVPPLAQTIEDEDSDMEENYVVSTTQLLLLPLATMCSCYDFYLLE
jgi:hypothetical protein